MSVSDGATGETIDYPLIGHREIERLMHPAIARLMAKARVYAPEDQRVGRFFVAEVADDVSIWRPEDEPRLKGILDRLWDDASLPHIGGLQKLGDPLAHQGEQSERLDDLPDPN